MGTEVLLYAALAVSTYSAVEQREAAKDSANEQRKARAAQQRSSDIEAQRARVQQIREARIRRAQILAATGNEGIGAGSSSVVGAVGSIGAQAASNVGNINVKQDIGQETSNALQAAADADLRGAQWQQIGNISQSIFQGTGGYTRLFGGNTFKPAK